MIAVKNIARRLGDDIPRRNRFSIHGSRTVAASPRSSALQPDWCHADNSEIQRPPLGD